MSRKLERSSPVSRLAASQILSAEDAALIREAYHLQHTLGASVWAEWDKTAGPLVYKTGTYEVLIGSSDPPDGFEPVWSDTYGDTVLVRPSDDVRKYRAAFPFEGTWTAVLSPPDPEENSARWVVLVAHELFHVWQNQVRSERILNPFVGKHADEHELSFPFPHDNDRISSLYRLEAEEVFRACTADTLRGARARTTVRLLAHANVVAPAVYEDSLAFVFKRWYGMG